MRMPFHPSICTNDRFHGTDPSGSASWCLGVRALVGHRGVVFVEDWTHEIKPMSAARGGT